MFNEQVAGGVQLHALRTSSLLDFRLAYSVFEGGKFALGSDRPNMSEAYGISGSAE